MQFFDLFVMPCVEWVAFVQLPVFFADKMVIFTLWLHAQGVLSAIFPPLDGVSSFALAIWHLYIGNG